jgi:hypothetical protein
MRITINPNHPVKRKPKDNEVGKISKGLNVQVETSLKRLAKGIKNGFCFTPAVFKGDRNNANWISQQLFALDFDSGFTPEEAFERLEEYNLTPQIAYTTFSDSPEKRKFRILIAIDKPILLKEERNWFVFGLLRMFPEADKAAKDPARLFYPGKEVFFLNEDYTPYEELSDVIEHIYGETGGYNDEEVYETKNVAKVISISSKVTVPDYDRQALNLVNNYMAKRGCSFTKGNKHRHNILYASVCNQFGIDKNNCLSELFNTGCYSSYTEGRVNDVYSRYSHQFGIKDVTVDVKKTYTSTNRFKKAIGQN